MSLPVALLALHPADGSLYDACLLAALAALASLRLHVVTVDDSGRIRKAGEDGAGAAPPPQQPGSQQQGAAPLRRLQLGCQPVSLTCGVYRGQLLVDPTAEEEPLLEALLTATVDERGDVLGERLRGCGACRPEQPTAAASQAACTPGACLPACSPCSGSGSGEPLQSRLLREHAALTALALSLAPAGFHKAGGSATASQQRVLECIEAAKMRGREVRGLLQQALEAAGGGGAAGEAT